MDYKKPKPVDPNLPDCPDCNGMGVVRKNSKSSIPQKCSTCKGTGKVNG